MTGKKLLLEFYDYAETPKTEGMKFVVFRVDRGGRLVGYEYGFAQFENGEFQPLEPGEYETKVVKWCELPNTQLLF